MVPSRCQALTEGERERESAWLIWFDTRRCRRVCTVNRYGRVIVVMVLMLSLSSAVSVHAAQTACGAGGNLFAGYGQNLGTYDYEGAYSVIKAQNSNLCTQNPGSPYEYRWAIGTNMIASGNVLGWVQSGFAKRYTGSLRHFTQVVRNRTLSTSCTTGAEDFCTYFWTITNPSPGSTTQYEDALCRACLNGQGAIQSKIAGNLMYTTRWSPRTTGNWTEPYVPQWFGETYYASSDIPGTSSARIDILTPLIRNGTSWQNAQAAFMSTAAPVHPTGTKSGYDGVKFQAWCSAACTPA